MGNTFSHLAACSGELSTSPQPGCLAQSPRLWAWWATRLGVARSRAQRPWSAGRELQCGAVDGAKLNRSEIQRGVTVSIFMQTNQFTDQRSGDENQLALPFNLAVAADPAQVAVAGIERILQAGRIGARRGRVNRRRRYLAQRFMRPLVIELVAEVIEALLLGSERGGRRLEPTVGVVDQAGHYASAHYAWQPQQNGRHERMHKTLKAETAQPPAARLADPVYASDFELRRVRSNGEIKWQGELIFIARPLVGEVIGLHEDDDGDAAVYFGPVQLGTVDGLTLNFEPCARRPLSTRARNHGASCPQGPQPLG